MDRIGAGLPRGADVLVRLQVRGDLDGLVGGARMQRAAIIGRDDRHGLDPERAARPEDAQRDLSAVRDQ